MTKRILPAFAAGVTLGLFALLAGGCAVGFKQDGTPVIGVNAGEPDMAEAERLVGEASTVAGAIFGPQAGVAVQGVAGIALAIGGLLYGKREERKIRIERDQSWDEAKADEIMRSKVKAAS